MSPAFKLDVEARIFADRLSGLLNATVCHGISLTPVATNPDRVIVGYRIGKTEVDVRRGIPLTLGKRKPRAFLGVAYRLRADAEGSYLAVESSFVGLFGAADLSVELLHDDYERGKGDGYPEAHLQIAATPPAWPAIAPEGKPFAKVHLPVGGRRYRPTLEELVEMCVVEGIADGRPGWRDAVGAGREDFRVRQLRAAIRRDPETARAALAEHGSA